MTTYRAKVGMNYPDPLRPGEEKRVEAGDIVTDLPAPSIPGLLEQGAIEPVAVFVRATPATEEA